MVCALSHTRRIERREKKQKANMEIWADKQPWRAPQNLQTFGLWLFGFLAIINCPIYRKHFWLFVNKCEYQVGNSTVRR